MSDRPVGQGPDILDLVQESVVVYDLDGRVLSWNAAAEQLYGWDRRRAIGRPLDALLQCRPPAPRRRGPADFPETGRWDGEITRTRADGAEVVARVHRSLRRDAAGRPLDIVETSVDITAARRTEAALKQAEYRYFNLFQAMAASFWELDFAEVGAMLHVLRKTGVEDFRRHFAEHPEFVRAMIRATRILDVNDQTVALFGGGDKRAVLEDLSRFWPDESAPIFAESVLAAVDGRPNYSHEVRFSSLDGRLIDTLFTACFPPEMVARSKLLVGIIDLSEVQQARRALEASERRYRNLFHFMPISLWQFDASALAERFDALRAGGVTDLAPYIDAHPGFVDEALDGLRVVEVNRRSVELVGARDAGELAGPIGRFWTESRDVFRRSLEARFKGAADGTAQMKLRTLDGRIIDAIYASAFFRLPDDTAVVLTGLVDVTDRVQAQEMLAQVQAEFAHAARLSMLGELTASIAHEVNQPLGAIATNGEAGLRWLDRPEPELAEVRELMVRTVEDARRAADIIRRIRGMAARTAPKRTPIALNEVIEEAMVFLRPELRRRGVTVACALAPDLPDLLADRVQLQQVVVNLAVNAMQAMAQAGTPDRRLTLRSSLADGRTAAVEIEDSGPGVPPDHLERLFDSFFTTKADGLGIGLAICCSIIEAHGGRIHGRNLPDRAGARFTFTLPVPAGPGRRVRAAPAP